MRQPLALRRALMRKRRSEASVRDHADISAQISRINDLTRAGRANWFALLAYLAFTMVTVLGVRDVDFFVPSRQTDLPLVGVAIPTISFFIFAPILGAALHVYLHLLVRKATEALAQAPAYAHGAPLERAVLPWLLNDLVLRSRRPDAEGRRAALGRPMDWLAKVTALFLIWCAGPLVLGFMWIRSMPAHDTALTTTIALCLAFTLYASLSSWVKMRADLCQPWLAARPTSLAVVILSLVIFLGLAIVSVLTTEGGLDRLTSPTDRPNWASRPSAASALAAIAARDVPTPFRGDRFLVRADLSGTHLAILPPDLADPFISRQRFRTEWCARMGLDPNVCGRERSGSVSPLPSQRSDRNDWCAAQRIGDCLQYFGELDRNFLAEWNDLRSRTVAALAKPDFARRDLRGAGLYRAELTGIVFTGADLEGVDLTGAQLERARFTCSERAYQATTEHGADEESFEKCAAEAANLRSADLSDSVLIGANLSFARLEESHLNGAKLDGAELQGARLEGAHAIGTGLERTNLSRARLAEARLIGANLEAANLDGADLSRAQLNRANLFLAHLRSADLSGARLMEADFSGASLTGSLAHGADFRGGHDLSQRSLSSLIGDAATLLPDTPDLATGQALFVCSCWTGEPYWIRRLIALFERRGVSASDFRDPKRGIICAEGEAPQKTGTPWPFDRIPAWDQQHADESDADYATRVADRERLQNRGDCPAR